MQEIENVSKLISYDLWPPMELDRNECLSEIELRLHWFSQLIRPKESKAIYVTNDIQTWRQIGKVLIIILRYSLAQKPLYMFQKVTLLEKCCHLVFSVIVKPRLFYFDDRDMFTIANFFGFHQSLEIVVMDLATYTSMF